VRYCSRECCAIGQRKPGRYVELECDYCGKTFVKRADHVKARNFCSQDCSANGRRKKYSKWRDPLYIKKYNREYNAKNRETVARVKREYAIKNPDVVKSAKRKWRKNNGSISTFKHRGRKKSLPVSYSEADWLQAVEYFHGCCAVCGRQGSDLFGEHYLARDHWIPLSYMGDDNPGTVPTNIVPLCQGIGGCNNSKGKEMPKAWLAKRFGTRRAAQIEKRIEGYFAWIDAKAA
jgi:hypothetical protein